MESNKQRLSILSINADAINSIKSKDHAERVYRAAMIYAQAGLYIVPLRSNTKFLPPAETGVNYGSATRKLETVERWFDPINGKFAGGNIGLATGKDGGIFVMDVDRHGDIDGRATLTKLMEGKPGFDSPMQITPNDGEHYVFQWEEYAKSSTGKIGDGIDTRGGEEFACKGHIVAAPSMINGKRYKWTRGGIIPIVPDWIMDKLGRGWSPKRGYGRGNEEVAADDMEETLPIHQIETMLDNIDIDDLTYDQWLRVGQAINSQYPDEDGLKVWD